MTISRESPETSHDPAATAPASNGQTGSHPIFAVPIDDELHTRNRGLDKVVFGITAILALGFLVWGFVSTATLASASGSALTWIMNNTGWLFALTASGFVVFVLWLALGKFGSIPLGCDDEEPEFRTISWVAMMFSAGMGIGLMFYGVGEPLSHFMSPPPGTVEAATPAAFDIAMATTLFHWTLHPWAIYAVVGLAIAYGTFRRGRRQLISSTFAPLLGRRGTEGFVEADRLDQVLTDRLVLGGEVRVAGKRLLDLQRLTPAESARRMPRQKGFDLFALGRFVLDHRHGQPRSTPAALSSSPNRFRA